jgi:hypothetical protein
MDKSWKVRCSNWEADHLSARQIEYAAHDAIVAVHIFLTLAKFKRYEKGNELTIMSYQKGNNSDISFPSTSKSLSPDTFSSGECTKVTFSLNKYEVEPKKGYVTSAIATLSNSLFYQTAVSLCKGLVDLGFKNKLIKTPSIKQEGFLNRETKKPYKIGKTQRKSPLYTNCQLVAPDGAMLCTLDRKKAEWYLYKDIGKLYTYTGMYIVSIMSITYYVSVNN